MFELHELQSSFARN